MIYTSNYARCGELKTAVAISASINDKAKNVWGFKGPHLDFLAPSWSMIHAYQDGNMDEDEYSKKYIELLISREINPVDLYKALTFEYDEIILLCYEPPNKFCHRRVLAKWIEDANHVEIPEWKSEKEHAQDQLVDSLLEF